ncbi:UNVERIFIED_CONTAM: hypothetical protein Slati_1279600 [Sesamum latifolium]|uniref:Uncharacterized protein n=1 Tax=Sesamum latifolium TaxID=2727402 RepID=A0AAW2XMC2_9LAMI
MEEALRSSIRVLVATSAQLGLNLEPGQGGRAPSPLPARGGPRAGGWGRAHPPLELGLSLWVRRCIMLHFVGFEPKSKGWEEGTSTTIPPCILLSFVFALF